VPSAADVGGQEIVTQHGTAMSSSMWTNDNHYDPVAGEGRCVISAPWPRHFSTMTTSYGMPPEQSK